jgi:hypothetical protein
MSVRTAEKPGYVPKKMPENKGEQVHTLAYGAWCIEEMCTVPLNSIGCCMSWLVWNSTCAVTRVEYTPRETVWFVFGELRR